MTTVKGSAKVLKFQRPTLCCECDEPLTHTYLTNGQEAICDDCIDTSCDWDGPLDGWFRKEKSK